MTDYDAVVAQHWDDERIREAFIDDGGLSEYYDPINGAKNNRRVMGAIFDAWLRSVKTKAWDECVSHLEVPLGQEVKRLAYADNPYREADG